MRRTELVVALAALASACGSRSALLGTEPEIATGGASSGGVSSGGVSSGGSSSGGVSSGGSGGGGPCNALVQVGPVLTPKNVPPNALDDGLRLTPTSDDGRQVTLAFLRKNPSGKLTLRFATLRPWDDWPSDGALEPVHDAGIETESHIAVGRSSGETWAALVRALDGGPRLYRNLDPHAGGPAPKPIAIPGIEPSFVARAENGDAQLAGTFDVAPNQSQRATRVSASGATQNLGVLGCASIQPPRASAVPYKDVWLSATSTGAATDLCASFTPGLPKSIALRTIGTDGSAVGSSYLPMGDTILDLVAAGGPYVVWSHANLQSVVAAKVSVEFGLVAGPVDVLPPGSSSIAFTAGSVGARLVTAHRDGASIVVSLFAEDLALSSQTIVSTGGVTTGPSVLYGSPEGAGVVVGWSENPMGKYTVHLARLDCEPS